MMRWRSLLCAFSMLVGCSGSSGPALGPRWEAPFGDPVEDIGSLRDLDGSQRSLKSFSNYRAIVAVFLSTTMPPDDPIIASLVEREVSWRRVGVQLIGVFSNAFDTEDRIASWGMDAQAPFPLLKDIRGQWAESLGIETETGAVVLNRGFKLCSRGSINRESLSRDVSAVLEDKQPAPFDRPREGSRRRRELDETRATLVSFNKDVAPILERRCQMCHRPGRSAPFSLLTAGEAQKHSAVIREVVEQRVMPPWHADDRSLPFANDRRLTKRELETLVAWVDQGANADMDPAPAPSRRWTEGWSIGKPDAIVKMPTPFQVPAEGGQSIFFHKAPREITDRLFDRDRWLAAAEVEPGEPRVTHHISVYLVRPGQAGPPEDLDQRSGVLGWAPGEPAYVFPKGSALFIPKGSSLTFEVHYVPNGRAVADQPRLALRFTETPPTRELRLLSPGNVALSIPPFDPFYRDEFTYEFPQSVRLLGLMGHMHLRGKSYLIEAHRPDGSTQTLLRVPRYDFGWQTFYWFKNAVELPRGTKLVATGWWDNSRNNPRNPNPADQVSVGPHSNMEMLSSWMFFETDRPAGSPLEPLRSEDIQREQILTP